LKLITAPLTPLRFTGIAGSLILFAAVFCLAHGFVIDAEIDLPRTLVWATTVTVPWVCAWEALKATVRLLQRHSEDRVEEQWATDRLRALQIERLLHVTTRRGVIALRACDIEYIKAAGNYVELIAGDRPLLMRATLNDVTDQLRAIGFVRVHRSLLVNALHVVAARRGPRGRRIVELRSGAELPVGRQFDENTRAFVTRVRRSSQRP
jgi:hypothetical protein